MAAVTLRSSAHAQFCTPGGYQLPGRLGYKKRSLFYCALQVVASEAEGQVSRSEKRQVALKTAKTGVSTLVTPRKPLPLEISHLEKLMLWLDWTRTFNRSDTVP